ncbi:hypothetical protein [Virgibacillus pantothenticus]|nr:hypothetical protein [Virgibacillus pantothenticus]
MLESLMEGIKLELFAGSWALIRSLSVVICAFILLTLAGIQNG